MANEIVKTFDDKLTDNLIAVEDALPKDFNRTRFVQNAMSVITNNPVLTGANKSQLMAGLIKGAYLGLDFMNKECFLVPYGKDISFQLGYKGACKFVKKYSIRPLLDIKAEIVREGDEISYGIEGNKPYLDFKPKAFNKGQVVGAFAVAYFADGGILYEVMNMDELNKVRNSSKCGRNPSSPWVTWTEEMYKKSALLRLSKQIETDFETVEAHQAWENGNEADNTVTVDRSEVVNAFAKNEEPNEENIIDSTAVEIETPEQFK